MARIFFKGKGKNILSNFYLFLLYYSLFAQVKQIFLCAWDSRFARGNWHTNLWFVTYRFARDNW